MMKTNYEIRLIDKPIYLVTWSDTITREKTCRSLHDAQRFIAILQAREGVRDIRLFEEREVILRKELFYVTSR